MYYEATLQSRKNKVIVLPLFAEDDGLFISRRPGEGALLQLLRETYIITVMSVYKAQTQALFLSYYYQMLLYHLVKMLVVVLSRSAHKYASVVILINFA